MSLDALKESLLTDQSIGEHVEVNQRHLIDKILARYSAENTIYRELLQNSNDAGATAVEIHFKTDGTTTAPQQAYTSIRDMLFKKASSPIITSVVYKNNGRPFQPEDWARLRSIASGNPDETKIGFFGVGFYSLFSICEDPFVQSGEQCMAFFWKGDQLLTKRGPVSKKDDWTTFYLKLREPVEPPNVANFGRFLATSLAFTKNLRIADVFIDDVKILTLTKKAGQPRPLEFPKNVYTLSSPNGIFDLKNVDVTKVQLDIFALIDYDKERGKPGTPTELSIFMRTATAVVGVKLQSQMAKEMERTTKKKAPPTTLIHSLFTNFDEFESSSQGRGKDGIFDDLIPGTKEQGRIFIGFPTHQTTGCSMHLAGHLIPTVERESIDFVDRTLTIWNQDLLTMGGLLARILFEDEMAAIANLYEELSLDSESETWLHKKATHALASFTFKQSTPSSIVGRIHSTYFYKLSNRPISMISTKGVLNVTSVRLPDPSMAGFLKETPVIPQMVMSACADFVADLQRAGMVQHVTLDDIYNELSKRTLTIEESVALLRWWLGFKRTHAVSAAESPKLFQLLVLVDPNSADKIPIRALDLKYHVNAKVIPPTLPLPPTTLSLEISKQFSKAELEEAMSFIVELTVPDWAVFVTSHADFKSNPFFVEKVMSTISRQFGNLTNDHRLQVLRILGAKQCIVTKQGLKLPAESYFKTVTLFEDLPTVAFDNPKAVSDTLLKALNVRDHVELQTVFSRLQDLKWDSDQYQLVKYLASVQGKLTDTEISRLRVSSLFSKEQLASPVDGQPAKSTVRYRANELFAPLDSLRALELPLIEWPTKHKWRNGSDEGKFLILMGLKTVIPLPELFAFASTSTPEKRAKFLAYFIDNWKDTYSNLYNPAAAQSPFLPTASDPKVLCKPTEIFADPSAETMGFAVLHPELKPHADKFGVRLHPKGSALVAALKQNPPSFEKAVEVFTYLAGRQSDFGAHDWQVLRSTRFIPIQKGDSKQVVIYAEPPKVYFGNGNNSVYQKQFTYVDFGEPSNAFLRACGVKDEPNPQELAQQVVRDPQSFLDQLGFQKYLQMLRTIAANYYMLRQTSLLSEMKRSAFLIGIRSENTSEGFDDRGKKGELVEKADDKEQVLYQLATAGDIYLIDDTVLGQLFTPLGAPMEALLEDMYQDLGSQWLSKQVTEVTTPKGQPKSTRRTMDLQNLIHERALLLLYDGQQVRGGKDIMLGAEDTLKTLEVVEVPEIVIERKFHSVTKLQRTTSCMMVDKRLRKHYLFISSQESSGIDYFDVAQSLGKVIFKKCRLNDSLLLSTLLSTSIINLRRKGFPVDRILNLQEGKLKAAEVKAAASPSQSSDSISSKASEPNPPVPPPKIPPSSTSSSLSTLATNPPSREVADAMDKVGALFPDVDPEFLRKQIEAERGSRNAVEAVSNRLLDMDYPKATLPTSPPSKTPSDTHNKSLSKVDEKPPMTPGGWPGSNPSSSSTSNVNDDLIGSINRLADNVVRRGWLGDLLGMSSAEKSSPQGQQIPPKNEPGLAFPPRSSQDTMAPAPPGSGPAPIEEITPQYTDALKQQLSKAVASVQIANEKAFRAQVPAEPEIPVEVPRRHAASSCTPLSDNDLVLAEVVHEVQVFVDKTHLAEAQDVLRSSRAGLQRFVTMLRLLARVFDLDPRAMNIYWDKVGGTVAFNRGRTLFFNLRFYLGLHFRTNQNGQLSSYYYWFLVACHELAHNFVADHNSQHEYYLTSFAENYLTSMNRILKAEGVDLEGK
ncbi:hypothetical protein HDV05_000995 [Chytridiales sp. JEL 0842]|nr:hypothetical protein HDV05_000995 [Chytridiales sp. JEL 0842]